MSEQPSFDPDALTDPIITEGTEVNFYESNRRVYPVGKDNIPDDKDGKGEPDGNSN